MKTKTYKWQLVDNSKPFGAQCQDCFNWIQADEPKIADLNGEAFKAYYHEKCALSLNNFKPIDLGEYRLNAIR